jgi:DNA polymerase IV
MIFHADMDAFFAAVEERDHPGLRGRPLVVGGASKRGVVSTANYAARKFGLHSAMPMVEALRRCPEVVVVPPDFERYSETSRRIMDVFHRYSPLVEPLSLDEAFLDMTGTEALFGPFEATARRLKRDVAFATGGLTVSVGVSANKYVAKVASDFQKPDGLTIVPAERMKEFLSKLEVSRLWGVGEKTAARIDALGFRTIGEVARASETWLEKRLGSLGPHVWRLANAIDDRPVVPDRDPKSVGKEVTLENDVTGFDAVARLLVDLADKVAHRLRRSGLRARGVRVKLKTAAFRLHTRQVALAVPADTAEQLLSAARGLLPELDLIERFRLVGLAAYDFDEAKDGGQLELFADPSLERTRRLARAVDAVRDKFGDEALVRASSVEERDEDERR